MRGTGDPSCPNGVNKRESNACAGDEEDRPEAPAPEVAVSLDVPPDAAPDISTELRELRNRLRLSNGPHGLVLRDNHGHVFQGFANADVAYAWVLDNCPDWRQHYARRR